MAEPRSRPDSLRGYGGHVAEILTPDLRLLLLDTGFVRDAGHRTASHRWAMSAELAFSFSMRVAVLQRVAHANPDQPIAANHVGGDLSFHHRLLDGRDVLSAESRHGRPGGIDDES